MAFRSANEASANTTSVTVTAPAGIADDDILIMSVDRGALTSAITWPTDFVEITGGAVDYAGGSLRAAWKRASSESGNYQASWTGSGRVTAGITAHSGAATSGTPVLATNTSGGASSTPDPPNLTGLTSSVTYDFVAVAGQEGKGDNRFTGVPTNYTERVDIGTSGSGSGVGHSSVCMATEDAQTGQTAENPGTFTSTVSDSWAALTISIAAPAVVTVTPQGDTPIGTSITVPQPFIPRLPATISPPVATLPTPTISVTAETIVTPAVIPLPVVTIPTPIVSIPATIIPATISPPIATVPTPTVHVAPTVTPAVISPPAATVPTPTFTNKPTIIPATISPPVATVPTPTINVDSSVTVTPAVIALPVVTIPTPNAGETVVVTPAVITLGSKDGFVALDGTGDYLNSSAGPSSGTGDFEAVIYIDNPDWTPIANMTLMARYGSTNANRSFRWRILSGNNFQVTFNDGGIIRNIGTGVTGYTDGVGRWLRLRFDADDGASSDDWFIDSSTESPSLDPADITWNNDFNPTPFGAVVTLNDPASEPYEIGANEGAELITGDIYYAEFWRDGWRGTGTRVYAADFRSGPPTFPRTDSVASFVWQENGDPAITLPTSGTTLYTPTITAVGVVVVTPAVITTTAAVPTPFIPRLPQTILTTTTIPTPTIDIGAVVVLPAVIAPPVATLPTPTITVAPTILPATISPPTATVPTPTLTIAPTATPATIAPPTVTVPTPTISTAPTVLPATIAPPVATVPTPTFINKPTITPATIAPPVATVPTPTLSIAPTVLPVTIEVIAAVPTPGLQVGAGATVVPATITATTLIPRPHIHPNPPVITTTVTVPTPTPSIPATTTPAVIAPPVAAVPTPTITIAPTILPVTVAAIAAVPTPTLTQAPTVLPATISPPVATVPTPTLVINLNTFVNPAVIVTTTTAPTPTLTVKPTLTPATIATTTTIPTPTAGVFGLAPTTPPFTAIITHANRTSYTTTTHANTKSKADITTANASSTAPITTANYSSTTV